MQSDLYWFFKEIRHFKWYFASIAIQSLQVQGPEMLLSVSSTEKQCSLLPSSPLLQNKHCEHSSYTHWCFLHFGAGLSSSSALLSTLCFQPAHSRAFLSFERLNFRWENLCQEPWLRHRYSTSTLLPNLSFMGNTFASWKLLMFWRMAKYVCQVRGHFNASFLDSLTNDALFPIEWHCS